MSLLNLKRVVARTLSAMASSIGARADQPKGAFAPFFKGAKKRGFYPATVVDVGVAGGTPGLYTSFPQAHFVMVEPLVEFEPVLTLLAKRYDAEYVQAAVGATAGTATFRIFGGLSSSTMLPGAIDGLVPDDARLRTVDVVTLDSLLSACAITAPVLLKLDIQGAELMALDGGENLLKMADMVVLESSLYRFHGPNMPDLYDTVGYMKERGYVVYDILGGFARPRDGALGQVDLVFVKEDGRLRESHAWD